MHITSSSVPSTQPHDALEFGIVQYFTHQEGLMAREQTLPSVQADPGGPQVQAVPGRRRPDPAPPWVPACPWVPEDLRVPSRPQVPPPPCPPEHPCSPRLPSCPPDQEIPEKQTNESKKNPKSCLVFSPVVLIYQCWQMVSCSENQCTLQNLRCSTFPALNQVPFITDTLKQTCKCLHEGLTGGVHLFKSVHEGQMTSLKFKVSFMKGNGVMGACIHFSFRF